MQQRRTLLTTLLWIAMFLVSTERGTALQSGPIDGGSFRGIVRDTSNSFLPGVRISVVNLATNLHRETTTNSTGAFLLENLPRGIYSIHAELPGFQNVFRVEALESGVLDLNFWLPAAPIRDGVSLDVNFMTGSVRDFDYVSLPKAKVSLKNLMTGKVVEVLTDARGMFSLSELPAGIFEIVAEREGFQSLRLSDIRLPNSFTAQFHLKLQRASGRASAMP